jgi:hypothetical protein
MWDLLFALAQVLSILFIVAGFGLITWHTLTRSQDEHTEE